MTEPTLPQRAGMMLKTLASTVSWVVAILATLARGKFGGTSGKS